MANTPLMDLQIIQLGQGGDSEITIWNKVISNFSRLDSHTHTPGDGSYITSAALQIDGSISFNNNQATQLNAVIFESQTVDVADKQGLYVKNGELVYRDQADNIVPITSAGGLAGTPGTIAGLVSPASASYDSLFGAFKFFADSNEYARLYSSDLVLSEFGVAGGFTTTLKVVGNTQNYSLTLPTAAPAANTSFLFNASGVATFTPAFKRGTTATNQVALVSSTDNTQLNGLTLANNQILLGTAGTPVSGQLTNAYVSATAAIAGTKISPAFGAQQITGSSGMNISAGAVSFGGNLSVTGTTTLSNDLSTTGNVTLSGSGKTFTVNTTASFASTLSVSGTTTAAAISATNISASGVSAATLLVSSTSTLSGNVTLGTGVGQLIDIKSPSVFRRNVTIEGFTTIGDSILDGIIVNARFQSSLVPSSSATRDLGESSLFWRNAYIDALYQTGTEAPVRVLYIDQTMGTGFNIIYTPPSGWIIVGFVGMYQDIGLSWESISDRIIKDLLSPASAHIWASADPTALVLQNTYSTSKLCRIAVTIAKL